MFIAIKEANGTLTNGMRIEKKYLNRIPPSIETDSLRSLGNVEIYDVKSSVGKAPPILFCLLLYPLCSIKMLKLYVIGYLIISFYFRITYNRLYVNNFVNSKKTSTFNDLIEVKSLISLRYGHFFVFTTIKKSALKSESILK